MKCIYTKPELLKIVDDSVVYDKRNHLTMGLTTAVELSYLTKDAQTLLFRTIEYVDATPSHAQAIKKR